MKKNYFILAAAATLFAACAETDVLVDLSEKENAPKAIGFETFANKTTRAELSDATLANFQVWGYKAPTANPMVWTNQTTVFDNVTVSKSADVWSYTDKKYWDKMSTYNFYAVAPGGDAVKDNYTIDPATGKITINNVISAKSTESMDYLIDRNGNTGVIGNYTTTHDDVSFDFNHIMSKVSFKLQSTINETVTVTSLTMTGWNSGNGKFVQTLTATPNTTDNTSEWSIPTAGTGNISLVTENVTLSQSPTELTDSYIMVPQTIDANILTFTINYKIGDEVFTGHVGKLAEAQTWGTDTHTIYTISVGPETIDFAVNSVNDWTNSPTTQPSVSID